MGAGLSKRSRNEDVGRSHSWSAQDTSRSLYKSFGGSFNQLRCVMHEFGSQNKCRSENYLKQKGNGAIVGLHSNWIGDFILACARPSDRIIQDHHLIHQFCSQNIRAVINLQEPGEHAGCGDGVIPEIGFSYNPELFMQDNILYFNFPWKSSHFMDEKLTLVICQTVGTQIAAGGKVAIHCHSGIGRTGLVIACYLLYSGEYDTPVEAIQEVREERPGTLQSKSQVQLVRRFDRYVGHLRIQFTMPEQRRKSLTHVGVESYPTLVESMVRQNELLCGAERQLLHYVPKVLDLLTRDLIRRTEFDREKREQIAITFMKAFTTDLSLSPDDELVQRAKARINAGDWSGVGELETSVLCHLLLEWLYQLQEPVVPDFIVTTALGRGDIESAIDELSKCDQCSFASLQCLVCWMFQMVPVQPKLIRRLYSALAHVLLANTILQSDQSSRGSFPSGELSPARNPNTARRHTMTRIHDVYTKYKPSLLEIEYGLLLEASARFWIKLGVARHEEIENKKKETVNTPPGPSTGPMPSSLGSLALKLRDKHRLGSFSQPWFRDRASLQYEQYNPGNVLEYQREMERGSIGGPSKATATSRFAEQKPKPITQKGEQKQKPVIQKGEQNPDPIIQKGEQKLKGVVQEEKHKPVPREEEQKGVHLEGKMKPVSLPGKMNAIAYEEKKPIDPQEKKKPVAPPEKKPLAQDEKKKPVAQEAKKKSVAHEEKLKAVKKPT